MNKYFRFLSLHVYALCLCESIKGFVTMFRYEGSRSTYRLIVGKNRTNSPTDKFFLSEKIESGNFYNSKLKVTIESQTEIKGDCRGVVCGEGEGWNSFKRFSLSSWLHFTSTTHSRRILISGWHANPSQDNLIKWFLTFLNNFVCLRLLFIPFAQKKSARVNLATRSNLFAARTK